MKTVKTIGITTKMVLIRKWSLESRKQEKKLLSVTIDIVIVAGAVMMDIDFVMMTVMSSNAENKIW
jgi:hypothetical protein